MSKNLMKLWPVAAATIAVTTSFAQADAPANASNSNNNQQQPSPQTVAMKAHPTARPGPSHGWDIFVTGEWLYWQANETGLGYALNNTGTDSAVGSMGSGSVKNPHFDWRSGFRVGLGFNMPHDQWDTNFTWTWFHDKAKGNTTVGSGASDVLFPTFVHPYVTTEEAVYGATTADANLKLRLNVLDWELGRQFYTGKWLSLRPFFGLRTAWVKQTYDVDYDLLVNTASTVVLDSYDTDISNKYWGIGVRGGLNTQWGLGAGFSIYGNAGISILYGFFKVHDTETYETTAGVTETVVSEKDSFRAGRAITDLQLGLRWDVNFSDDRFHFGINAGWEHHMFFSQNQFLRFVSDEIPGAFVQNQGDLDLQGWTVGARFDF